jgi:hypothetical protein
LKEEPFISDGSVGHVVVTDPNLVLQSVPKIEFGIVRTPENGVRDPEVATHLGVLTVIVYAKKDTLLTTGFTWFAIRFHIVHHGANPNCAKRVNAAIVASDAWPAWQRKQKFVPAIVLRLPERDP